MLRLYTLKPHKAVTRTPATLNFHQLVFKSCPEEQLDNTDQMFLLKASSFPSRLQQMTLVRLQELLSSLGRKLKLLNSILHYTTRPIIPMASRQETTMHVPNASLWEYHYVGLMEI